MIASASALVDLARQHLGEPYVLGANVPLDARAWKGPWDCAEFVSWLVYQTTGRLVGLLDPSADVQHADPYSGGWARDALATVECGPVAFPASKVGPLRIPISIACGTPGAVLVRTPQPGAGGHVALSAGDGDTIEAYDSRHGVIASRSVGRRWDYGLLVGGLQFDLRLIVSTPPKVLVVGSRGEDVRRLQAQLAAHGYPCDVDGDYGRETCAQVVAFERANHLVPDGEAGPIVFRALGLAA